MSIEGIKGIVDQELIDFHVNQTKDLSSGGDDGFDHNMFLNILMTQLQNQDPFNTTDSNEILNQQAMLTQVEQVTRQTGEMQELNANFSTSLAQISESLAQINANLNTLVEQGE